MGKKSIFLVEEEAEAVAVVKAAEEEAVVTAMEVSTKAQLQCGDDRGDN